MPTQACFRPIQLFHDYSAFDGAYPKRTIPERFQPQVNPITAIVAALFNNSTNAGLTQAQIFEAVELAYPGIYDEATLEVAFRKANSQGILVLLVAPNQCEGCCEVPTPRYTYSLTMDQNPANQYYVAYLYSLVTATVELKKQLFVFMFRVAPNCGPACCSGGTVAGVTNFSASQISNSGGATPLIQYV